MEKELLGIIEIHLIKITAMEQLVLKHHPEWREDYEASLKKSFSTILKADSTMPPMITDFLKDYLNSRSDE